MGLQIQSGLRQMPQAGSLQKTMQIQTKNIPAMDAQGPENKDRAQHFLEA